MLHLFRWRPLLIGSVLLLMLGSLLVSLLPVPTVLAAGNITGTVYQDYNANGARDTSGTAPNLAIDAGVGGVTVTAYSAAGAVVATATSSSLPATLGQYTLNLGAVADSTPLRIEFTGLPSGFQPAPHGSNNATNLRFASATAAAQGGLDFGIMRPAEYCQNNPTLFTTCFTSGDPLAGGTAATGDALIAYPYTAIGQNPALLSHLTLSQQIGATWGLAYRRATHQLFTGALMKRHAGLGPLGTGGLYVVDYSNPALPATSNFLDLQTLAGVSTGTDPRSAPGYPALPANKNVSSLDPGAFDAVGKIGLGGIDLSTDENTLYVMNLNSRELLAVDLASKTLVSRTAVGNPGCTNAADVRPWAVKVHDGQVYIGVVCSAQSSGNRADLDFLIARLNGGAFTTVFNGDLGYTKGATHSSFPAACNRWEPWATTFADLVRIGSVAAGTRVCRPQPILSDLEFDTDGSIIAGFVDRTGHQTGVSQRATSAADATLYSGYVNGDILRIYNNAGTFVLESGGTTPAGGGCGLNGQGPGGGEFYCGEFYSTLHNETSLGGLARWPGANELPLTVMDPLDIFSGGVSWMNNSTGADNRRYELFSNTIGGAVPITNTGTFGKAAGLGDIEALCDAAPIEIGNRVWSDTNQNGIQDAGEPGIAGVTVTLYDDAGAAVPNASAITDGSGAYFFSSAAGTNSTSAIYNLPIAPNTSYSIRIDNPADFGPGGVLADAALAPANADASANGDTRDSDAVANAPGDVRIAVGTGPAGANDHTYDAGFTPQLRLGNLVWDDANNNGLKDPAESGIGSVPVNLYRDSDNNGVPDGLAIDTTLTVAGVYTFTGLISDTYIVEIVPPPGYRSSTGANGAAIGPYEGAATPDPDSNIDGDDNGTSAGATIRSKPIALAANSEPDVGVDGDGTSGNLTVDFGLFQPYSLGNRVWFDLNNNGAIDPGESGIANQPVYLLSSDGTTLISSTSTLNGGYYRFDNLGAGDYLVAAETPAGYISSTRGEEADPNADGDSNDNGVTVNGTTMRSAPVTLGASAEPTGETDLGTGGQGAADNHANMTVDFGFTQPVALGNLIWFDADNNHLFDLGESGIVSVTVQLFPAGANPLTSTATLTTTTAGGGFYVFDQLAPGQYFAFIPPSQFGPGGALEGLFSTTGSGSSPSADDDLDENGIDSATPGTTGISSMVYTLLPNSLPIAETGQGSYGGTLDDDNVNLTADFGFHEHVALGNLVWFDSNNDGVKDPGESVASDVEVRLFTSGADPLVATPVLTTTTDASGRYVFDQLVPGQYFVHIPPSQFGPGGALHGATSSTGSGTSQAADQDVDENGIDAATPATTGISSMVYNLQPNSLPIGDDDTGYTGTLDDDNVNLTADFGFFTKVALGNLVWFDSNNNGVKDPAESGIKDVTVLLFPAGASPLTGTATLTTTTDASGRYVFDQLVPGQYFVHIPPGQFGPGGALAGHVSSTGSGTSQAADQDVDENGIDAATPAVTGISSIAYNLQPNGQPIGDDDTGYTGTLDDNDTNLTADFGFYTPVNLGNLVWHDANNNGAKDPAESGIDGVGLQLFASGADPLTATPILTTTSSGGGLYHFDTLAPGSYFVYLPTPPAAYPASSTPTDPADNGQDNDDNGAQAAPGGPTRSPDIALSAGGEPGTPTDGDDTNGDQTIDFGFFAAYSLGNRVWYDTNDNGQIDPAESGIAGVVVSVLADANGDGIPDLLDAPIATVTTDSAGYYRFDDLPAGGYVVRVEGGTAAGQNYGPGGALVGYTNSTPTEATPDSDADSNDNGINTASPVGGGVLSGPITLGPGASEPAGESEPASYGPGATTGSAAADLRANLTVDFGFYRLAVGNLLWYDGDNDGLKDPAESPLGAGVLIELRTAGGTLVATTTTISGTYSFDRQTSGPNAGAGLVAGDYLVQIPAGEFAPGRPLDGYVSSAPTEADPDTNVDEAGSGPTPGDNGVNDTSPASNGIRSGTLTLTPGSAGAANNNSVSNASGSTTNPTLDFGFTQLVRLGNRVWIDQNGDGLQGVGEPGLAGATVTLFAGDGITPATDLSGSPVAPIVTGATGAYTFTALLPGDYVVRAAPPAGYIATRSGGDPDNDDNTDSNGNPVVGQPYAQSTPVTLTVGGEPDTPADGDGPNGNLTVDFGFFQPVSVGDFVWEDQNGNGLQDSGEPGVAGVTATLFAGGIATLTTTTDLGGQYLFANLPPGQYEVHFSGLPGGLVPTIANVPGDDTIDSDGLIATSAPLAAGAADRTLDLGLLHPLSLGNLVFEDGDNNGSFDSVIDRPLAGATVVLFKGDGITPATDLGGAPVINQTTGTNGLYLFTNLAPGAYVAKVLGPAGYTSSDDLATTAGPDGNLNDDDNGVGTANLASSQPITLTSSLEPTNDGDADPNSNLTLDFGFWKPLRLGNLVWLDINNNGVKDLAEGGINGVAVDLYADANGDGLPGGGELAGSTTTSGGGLYQFTNLRPGDYIVVIGAPNFAALGPLEHLASSSGGASEPAPDVDANPADGDDNGTAQPGGSVRSAPLTLTSGGEPDTAADGDDTNGNQTVDFGFYPLAAIGDTTWLDTNSDGVLNNGEAGLPGVTVRLYRPGIDGQPGTADDVLAGSTVSGVNGAYSFTDLPAGDYFVQFTAPAGYALSPQDQGGNDAADSDADSTTGRTIITTLVPGENDPTWDAGLIYNASLGDRVWLDQNANGVQDAGEPGVPGVTVVLRDAGGTPVLTTTTDLSGSYGFARLAPGSYSIAVLPPSGYQASPADQGGSDTADSDIDPASGHTGPIVIAVGTADPSWDAGLYQEVSLGNLVWNDINNNGLVDRGEPGVGGVLVRLYRDSNANGILDGGDLPAGSTTTSAGLYLFDQLTPGRYLVQLDPANFAGGAVLAGYASSTGGIATNLQPGGPYEPAPNPNTDIDNDDSGSTGQGVVSGPVVLSSAGEPTSEDRDANSNLTIDFGVFMPASVGSVVWFDTNGDGVRDPGEAGVPNVTVTLYDANGQALASTTTGPDGTYLFTDLPPGVYTLGVSDLPQGLVFTSPNQGSDDSRDSDVDPATGRTEPITLVPGSNQPNWWAGLIPNPTAVTLRSFTATWRGSVLEVAWETSAELHSLGFYLYRSTTGRRGDAVLVTPSLIAARGRGQGGAAYTWYDGSTEPGQRYSYWLAEIELNGRVNEYGPADSAGTAARQVLYVPVVVR